MNAMSDEIVVAAEKVTGARDLARKLDDDNWQIGASWRRVLYVPHEPQHSRFQQDSQRYC